MTVEELLARISSAELSEWKVWAEQRGGLEPYRADVRAAQIAAILANVNRRKGARPYTVADFMPPMFRPAAAGRNPRPADTPASGKVAHAGTEAFRQYLLAMGAKEVPKRG